MPDHTETALDICRESTIICDVVIIACSPVVLHWTKGRHVTAISSGCAHLIEIRKLEWNVRRVTVNIRSHDSDF